MNKIIEEGVNPSSVFSSFAFKTFLKRDADRLGFIVDFLKKSGILTSIISLSTGKHVLVNFPKKNYNKHYKDKIFIAHYDRFEFSEGANDNSAASFILMNFAIYLSHLNYPHNIRIIFTDSEEKGGKGISQQGSYKLALALKNLNFDNADVYIFDMCGRGDSLIFSRSGLYGRENRKISSLIALHNKAISYARELKFLHFSMLTAYSDNAGFVAAGLNAQLVTVLPYGEAVVLKNNLENSHNNLLYTELVDSVLKNKKLDENSPLLPIVPITWQKMHTALDSLDSLTDYSYHLVMKYMKFLSKKMERW